MAPRSNFLMADRTELMRGLREQIHCVAAGFQSISHAASGELKAAELLGTSEGEHLNEQAAWTTVARVLMNLDETVTKG